MAVLRFPGRTSAMAAASIALAACSGGTSTETIAPVTGVVLRAESVTAGKGCGRGATQVFKYVVVVGEFVPPPAGVDKPGTFGKRYSSNIFDCFADGTFVELPADENGYGKYSVLAYAFNETAWRSAGGDASIVAQTAVTDTFSPVAFTSKTNPTWSTRCDATQQLLAESVMRCDPLSTSKAAASVALALAAFGSPSGPLTCDKDYTKVIYRFSTNGGQPGATSETPCSSGLPPAPVTIQISPAVAPASYEFEVAPMRADGTVLGQTTCRATTSPGVGSSAECAPITPAAK